MATTSTMGQPTRTANKVWWAIAVVAAIIIVMALMSRNRDGGLSTTRPAVSDSTIAPQNTGIGVPAGTGTGVAPTTPTNTAPRN